MLDSYCKAAAKSMGCRHPDAPAKLKYHVEKFSAAETEAIRARGAKICGVLADAQYHAVVSLMELHQLHRTIGWSQPQLRFAGARRLAAQRQHRAAVQQSGGDVDVSIPAGATRLDH